MASPRASKRAAPNGTRARTLLVSLLVATAVYLIVAASLMNTQQRNAASQQQQQQQGEAAAALKEPDVDLAISYEILGESQPARGAHVLPQALPVKRDGRKHRVRKPPASASKKGDVDTWYSRGSKALGSKPIQGRPRLSGTWTGLLRELGNSEGIFEDYGHVLAAADGRRWGIARQHHAIERLCAPAGGFLNLSLREMHGVTKERAVRSARSFQDVKHKLLERCKAAETDGRLREITRWFAVSNRKDFTSFAAEELMELGLCNSTRPPQTGIDFYVGEQFETAQAPSKAWGTHFSPYVKKGAEVGAMPGIIKFFGTKLSFANMFEKCDGFALANNPYKQLCDSSLLFTFNVDAADVEKKSSQRSRRQSFTAPTVTSRDVHDLDRVYRSLLRLPTPIWFIVKPQTDTYLSRGMHLSRLPHEYLKTKQAFLDWIGASVMAPRCLRPGGFSETVCNRRKMSFQRYVHTPALFGGRKFDVRIWLVVTSVDPLRVFMMRHGYPKIASMPFSKDPKHLENQCMHIKMLLPDDSCPVGVDEYLTIFARHGYPKSTASPVFFDSLRFPGLTLFAKPEARAGPDTRATAADRKRYATLAEHVWSAKVWPGIEASMVKTLMLVRPGLLTEAKKMRAQAEARAASLAERRGAPGPPPQTSYSRWALLSPDVVVDDAGKASVVEINTNGHMLGTHDEDGGFMNLFHDEDYVKDLFQLLGAADFPKRPSYAAGLDASIDAFCTGRPDCDDDARDAIRRAVDEEAHAGPHWYRVYPPISCRSPSDAVRDSACVRDDLGSWWPHQARLTEAQFQAFQESSLDSIVRQFLADVDTSDIHGIPQVPGPGRWQPRARFYESELRSHRSFHRVGSSA